MANNVLNTRIVLRHDTTANWEANASQVLLKGEAGIEFLDNQSVRIKIGDGVKPWSELPYFGGESGQGVIVIGDGKTIKVEGGTVSLYGANDATNGQSPRISADGELEWYTPLGTSEVQTVLESTLSTSVTAKSAVEKIVTDSETVVGRINEIVDEKVSTVYKWKGSVDSYADLPKDGNKVGDTYNVVAADPEHKVNAGDNLVWDGSDWDNIGSYIDLTNYAEKSELEPLSKKLQSMPTGILSEITGVNQTETEATVDIKVATLQPDGTYSSETKQAAITLEAAGEKAGLMSLADKLKLDSLNVIKSSDEENKIKINSDGTAEVNSVSVDKLVEKSDVTLVLMGGSATATI